MNKTIAYQDKYVIGLYCASNFYDVPLERNVTELIKKRPHTTLIDLIKHTTKNPMDKYEKDLTKQVLWFIEVWEDNSEYSMPSLAIFALDKKKKVREFNDYVKEHYATASEICLLPSAKAKDIFEKTSKGYRLDLWINLNIA